MGAGKAVCHVYHLGHLRHSCQPAMRIHYYTTMLSRACARRSAFQRICCWRDMCVMSISSFFFSSSRARASSALACTSAACTEGGALG